MSEIIKTIRSAYDNNHHRLCIESALAWLSSINIYRGNKITLIDNPYLYEVFERLTIVCYYVNEYKSFGYFLTEFLLLNDIRINQEMINANKEFYAEKLDCFHSKLLHLKSYPLLFPKKPGDVYRSINPSVLKINEGYLINCRLINYDRPEQVLLTILDSDKQIKTKNIILILDKEFNKIEEYELEDKSWRKDLDLSKSHVIGVEDLILFKHEDSICCSFTSLDSEPIGRIKQNIAKLKLDNNRYIIDDVQVMKTNFNTPEKNWLYINQDGKIKFIHSHQPFGVRLINYSGNIINETNKERDNEIVDVTFEDIDQGINFPGFNHFRGSAPPLPFSYEGVDGWLSIIHEVIRRRDNNGLCYLHRFLFYNSDLRVKYISKIFYFEHRGIEFCRSMCYSHDNDRIIIGVGIKDLYAKLFEVDIETIKSMMIPLDKFQFTQ